MQLPYSQVGESALLTYALSVPDGVERLREFGAQAEDFFLPNHFALASTLFEMQERSIPVTQTTVVERLQSVNKLELAGGMANIASLASAPLDSLEAVQQTVKTLQDKSMRRMAITRAVEYASKFQQENTPVEELVFQAEMAFSSVPRRTRETVTPLDAVARYRASRNQLLAGGRTWAKTYIAPLDRAMQVPFKQNDYVIWSARPGDGKSSIMRYVLAARSIMPPPADRKGVLYLSFEETIEETVDSIVAMLTGIPNEYLTDQYHLLNPEQKARIAAAEDRIAESPCYLIQMSMNSSVAEIASEIKKYKRLCFEQYQTEITAVGIDYVNKLASGSDQGARTASMARISAQLRELAQPWSLGVEMHVAAQIGRSGKDNPTKDDLADSDALTRDATKIFALSREKPSTELNQILFNYPANQTVDPRVPGGRVLRTPLRIHHILVSMGKVRRGSGNGLVPLAWNASTNTYFEREH